MTAGSIAETGRSAHSASSSTGKSPVVGSGSSRSTHVLQPACSGVAAIAKPGSCRQTRAPRTQSPGRR